jgi:hypothetical protein
VSPDAGENRGQPTGNPDPATLHSDKPHEWAFVVSLGDLVRHAPQDPSDGGVVENQNGFVGRVQTGGKDAATARPIKPFLENRRSP